MANKRKGRYEQKTSYNKNNSISSASVSTWKIFYRDIFHVNSSCHRILSKLWIKLPGNSATGIEKSQNVTYKK